MVLFGGKGGVGKTTLAAAHALNCADAGMRTLLMSTDPAHSLGDALGVRLGDRPVRVAPDLWVCEPDGPTAVRRRIRRIVDDAYAALPREIMPAVERHLKHAEAAPGMAESALTDLLVSAMEDVPDRWDRLVVDSAPTGHLLRMIELPTLMAPWVHGLTEQRERALATQTSDPGDTEGATSDHGDDPLLDRLRARRDRMERAARRLRSDAAVRLVLLPRRVVLAETVRAADHLRESGFPLAGLVLNQVPPDADPAVLAAVRAAFPDLPMTEVALRHPEPTGVDALRGLLS
nr:ArsA family ATPase [Spiractinospora alimapuensis]